MSSSAKTATLRKLEKKKESYFRRMQQIYDLIPEIKNNETVKNNFIIRYQTIAETRASFHHVVDEIYDLSIEVDPDADPNFEMLSAFDDLYGAVMLANEKIIAESTPITQYTRSSPVESSTQLPQIKIKSFSGKIKDWPEFRDLFTSVIMKNKNLSDAQRYHYLRTSLEPEALKIISSFPLSSEHFRSAWTALEDRFNNKRLLAAHFFDEMFSLPKPVAYPTVESLQAFLSQFNDAVVGLNNLQIEDLSDLIILNLALRRLDMQTIKAFEKEQVNIDFPKYADLVSFIKNQLRVLEITAADTSMKISPRRSSSETDKSQSRDTKRVFLTKDPMSINPSNSSTYLTPQGPSQNSRCPLCQSFHPLYKCPQFQQMPLGQRLSQIHRLKVCRNCLSVSHTLDRCRSSSLCYKCGERHHTLIHNNSKPNPQSSAPSSRSAPTSSKELPPPAPAFTNTVSEPCLNTCGDSYQVLLGTALIHFQSHDGNFSVVRALLDPASTHSCISAKCVSRLGLSITPTLQPFTGLGGVPVVASHGTVSCLLKPRDQAKPLLSTKAFVIPEVVGKTPPSPLPQDIVKYYKNFQLADPSFGDPGDIDFLLGADLFMFILSSKSNHYLGKNILNTIFGAVVMGPIPYPLQKTQATVLCTSPCTDPSSAISRFWEVEEVPQPYVRDPLDDLCEHHFISTFRRNAEGRYIVRLPFKQNHLSFPESRNVAVKRFLSLERRFEREPELKAHCISFLKEYSDLGHMEPTMEPAAYTLPYFCVQNPHSVTTPVRVVFDGSAKHSHLSLNDSLYAGPKLQKDLPEVLLNFRMHQFVFSCDIVKMYRQVLLAKEDRKFVHILFRENPTQPLREYHLNTVTYGLSPSAWHAQRVLRQLVCDEGNRFPCASRVLLEDTFVDDIITGADSISDLCDLQKQLVQLLRAGGFELSKWSSNSPAFLAYIKSSYASPLVINDVMGQSVKVLGIRWEPTDDVFSYQISQPALPKVCTKRSVLSLIARIFDPLGFLAPLTFKYKCFMQELWKQTELKNRHAWDEPLSEILSSTWIELTTNLSCLSQLRLSRCVLPNPYQSAQVTGFCDASELGYGCVIYLKAIDKYNKPHISLLIAKSKVAPLKTMTIPRLELAGSLLLAQTLTALNPFLSKITLESIELFTDSTIVLSWLNKPLHTLKMFVASRVAAILEVTHVNQWHHIDTGHNPADIVSRGLKPTELLNCGEWFKGPSWLQLPRNKWPLSVWTPVSTEKLPELKSSEVCLVVKNETIRDVEWMTRCSDLNKIQRVQAYFSRYMKNLLLDPSQRTYGHLSLYELRCAMLRCVAQVQAAHFWDEIQLITDKKLKSSRLLSLSPFIDAAGLLRVGGRLKASSLSYSVKHPLLLPKRSHFTNVLIDHFHKLYLHAGPRTLHAILQRSFWILSAHTVIRQRIRQCIVCSRFVATAPSPIMADLPAARVTPSRPFLKCGVDLAGPLLVKDHRRSKRSYKAYFALFICLATKAVHLEALTHLTTEAFLATLHRFVARRGLPSDIYCDQATNFRGAARELEEITRFLSENDNQRSVSSALSKREINFHFICPKAPFMGGIWEGNIKNVKFHLRRVVGNQILTFEELNTLLARIEAVLNSRPLCDISTSPDEPEALTPGHFLTGGPLLAVSEAPLHEEPLNRLSRWQMVSNLTQHFWQRWSQEYLHTLQQKSKWFTSASENLKSGQLVWIKEDGLSPLSYPLGKIEEVLPNSKDGVVRMVSVRTARGIVRRPVRKLAPLFLLE